MKRSWHVWIPFCLCLAVVLAAMGWISLAAMDLDRAELELRRQAAVEENARLALWRIDFALAPVLARENARPYFVYSPLLPVDRAYGRMFNRPPGKEAVVASPLLGEVSPYVLVHFQFHPDGRLTSPGIPEEANYDLAVPEHVSEEMVERRREELKRVSGLTDRQRLVTMLPEREPAPAEVVFAPANQPAPQGIAQHPRQAGQQRRGAFEFQQRNQAVAQSTNLMVQSQIANPIPYEPPGSTDMGGVLMTPLWIDGHLILARRTTVGGAEYVQGCLLDWPGIKGWLLGLIEDLLPEAELESMPSTTPDREARMLAALPVQLVAGRLAMDGDGSLSAIRLSLSIAWGCVLVAAVALAVLLWGLIRLSERRAAFVSAVTHELRTPLTTFHMYTEMLAEGMVPDVQQRQHYLSTLRAEASRLSHLVENVLAYARLERGRADGRVQDVSLDRLLEPLAGRLADRARQAGMELVVEAPEAARSATVRANPSAVEQILFNLVDNACKYAADAPDRRIHLALKRTDAAVLVRVRDHGPGISYPASRRLFRPFSKSAREAAHSAPGVGLGLALSRRLARDMGARLRVDKSVTNGAAFVLTLTASSQ